MNMEKEVKTVNDRASESVRLCKQLLGLGILNTDPAYVEIQEHMNAWIRSDEKKIYEHIEYMMNKLNIISIKHIYRENNGIADSICNKILDNLNL